MAIADDFSVSSTGDIRYVGTGPTYTVIAFHRWLGDLMDDAQASGNDILDITDATASERATDNLIKLNSPYNINDYAARFLYDGSIVQGVAEAEIYDGIVCFAPANTHLQVIQDGETLSPNFWTTAYNADSTQGISHRFMVKVRTAGADIDGRRLIGQTRELGKTFSEFKINGTSRGNNVFALQFSPDLNNTTIESTIKGWTTVSNTEGYRLIDISGDTNTEPYYAEWNRGSQTINQFYERTKYLSRRATTEASCTDVGTDFTLGNGTITGQAQSFTNGTNAQYLVRAFIQLSKTLAPTGNVVAKLYAHSGSLGTTSIPTGAALATSNNVSLTTLSASYSTVEFYFPTPFEMVASTDYVLSIEYSGGSATDYLNVRGLATTGTHAGNRSENTGAWAATATDDLNFLVQANHKLYTVPGEQFRGITHELDMTTPRSGSFATVERVSWPTGTGILLAVDSVAASTKMWIQVLTGVAPATGILITGAGGATGTTTGAATERSLSYPFIGASTGAAIIGAYGIGMEAPSDVTASDKFFDLGNVQRTPPNNVTFTVAGLEPGQDRVLVGPESGAALQVNQFTLNGTLNAAGITSVVVTPAIPSDTPKPSGTIRILLDTGIYRRVEYTSWTGSTFTIASTDFSGVNAATTGNNTFISYIDKLAGATDESFSVVYATDRSVFVRVRDGAGSPIKTFETTGTVGSAGGSATAIRTSDA